MSINNENNLLNKKVVYDLTKFSHLDFPNHLACIVWLVGCDMRCDYCYNKSIVFSNEGKMSFNDILSFLKKRIGLLEAVVLSGGEATGHDLIPFCKEVKKLGFLIKLDTNGTNPGIIEEAISKRIVDYIAMDIKAPLEFDAYNKASKVQSEKLFKNVKESIKIIMSSDIDYEFRTTVVPGLHDKEDIRKIVEFIRGAKRYALQNFQPDGVLDKKLQEIKPYKKEILEKIADGIRGSVESVIVRGRE